MKNECRFSQQGYYVYENDHFAIRLGTSRGTTYFVSKNGSFPLQVNTSQQLVTGKFINSVLMKKFNFYGYGNYNFMPW